MSIQEIFIVKSDIADDTEPVGDHAEFIGIAEMSVGVHLLDGRIGGGMGGHRTISSLVRIKILIKVVCFGKCFQLFDDAVGILWIIFGAPGFDTRGIKDSHRSEMRIEFLAYRFRQINHTVKHSL